MLRNIQGFVILKLRSWSTHIQMFQLSHSRALNRCLGIFGGINSWCHQRTFEASSSISLVWRSGRDTSVVAILLCFPRPRAFMWVYIQSIRKLMPLSLNILLQILKCDPAHVILLQIIISDVLSFYFKQAMFSQVFELLFMDLSCEYSWLVWLGWAIVKLFEINEFLCLSLLYWLMISWCGLFFDLRQVVCCLFWWAIG